MNHYEAQQAARRERYEARADAARHQSDAAAALSAKMAEAIPFGQPILVGHHSESADRRYRQRIGQQMDKAVALDKKADHYAQKAAAVGKGGISSDDPDAIEKLKAQLRNAQANQDLMKKANAVLRQHKSDPEAAVLALDGIDGITEATARVLLKPDYAGRVGFASYQLTNNNANIRRIAARIKDLERAQERTPSEVERDGYTYREDPEENRAMFLFAGKPEKGIRDILKRHGFRWSPTRSAWVRQLTGNAQWAAQRAMQELDADTQK